MAIKITSTKDAKGDGVKALVYGKAGIGKTKLMGTAPNPIILSAEAGLLSLKDQDIPVILIETIEDVHEAYEMLTGPEGDKYDTICLDSISEIAEVLLTHYKKTLKDGRQAYGTLNDDMNILIRHFRDIKGKNVIFSAKQMRVTDDDTGITSYNAMMPGKNLVNGLPFFFDLVLYMTMMTDEDGTFRALKTEAEFGHDAKDRSGELDAVEEPNLTKIFNKINGVK